MGKAAVEQKNKKIFVSDEEPSDTESVSNEEGSSSEEEGSKKRLHNDDDSEVETEEDNEGPVSKKSKVEAVQKEASTEGDCTVWVGQLSFRATEDDIQAYFDSCGTITEVRLRTDPSTGNSRGFAYIDFADAAGKKAALELDGTEFMERYIKVDNANAAKPRNNNNRPDNNSFGPKTNTVFVANLAHCLSEDDVRQAFAKFGNIVGEVRLPFNRDTGKPRGFGYVQFETEDEAEAAVKAMNGVSIEGRPVRTDFSSGSSGRRPTNDGFKFGHGRGGGRGGNRGGDDRYGNRSGGFRGGRDGNRSGFRGRGAPRY
ncbi:hypothetical protein BDF20DRAFT_881649 [Mycotypha africana]|uniref:uncharacterized protein n=1 Tax=Mycotypha africana TaxID=64632 RepID=UPI0023000749|nr:uncharacterized protein BDF20DRAFT_881649 [Mycotypha africana]KAI8973305.1 hypothetical protein BDF20DRAFT_881649 [Mycotypha africana]